MEKIRIENDFVLQVAVTRGGNPEDFSGLQGDIEVELRHVAYSEISIVPAKVERVDSQLNVSVTSDLQVTCGKYRLTLTYKIANLENPNGFDMVTYDMVAFELVAHSDQAHIDGDVQMVIISADTAIGSIYKGEQGEQGPAGPMGPAGQVGPAGEKGEKGDPGTQGVKGDKGDTGDSAYEDWLTLPGNAGKSKEDFFATFGKGETGASAYKDWLTIAGNEGKTLLEFIDSIKGEKGDKGDTGAQGIQGVQGTQGEQGAQGIQGVKGDKGDTGDKGDQGEQGIQGVQGEQGLQGIQGVQGLKGDKGDSDYQTWLTISGNAGKTLAEFYAYLQLPASGAADAATTAALAAVATARSELQTMVENASIAGIVNTVETGFYVTDSNGNVGLGFDANGLDVTQFSSNTTDIISDIASNSPKTDTPATNIIIYGDKFIQLSNDPVIFTNSILPLGCTDKRVMWKCDNGIIYGQDDTSCKIKFLAIGYALITCYSLSDPTIYATYQVSILNALTDPSVILNYRFSDSNPLSAVGTIEIAATVADTYTLWWGDDSGVLDGMSEMYSVDLSSEALSSSRTLVSGWMVPSSATKIYAKSSTGTLYGFALSTTKLNSTFLGEKLYSFGLISDSHSGTISSNTGYALTNDIPTALQYYNEQGCNFICGAGDITNTGTIDQLDSLSSRINSIDYNANLLKVYTGKGNHDIQTSNDQKWFDTFGSTKDIIIRHGDPSLTTYNGLLSADVYRLDIPESDIFMFQSVGNSYGSKPTDDIQQAKFAEIVNNNKDKRIFYFMHVPMYQTVGDTFSSYDLQDGIYPQLGTTYYNWFMNLMRENKNVIFFSGHTHFCYEDALNDPNTVVFDGNGEYGWFVHIPSLGRLRKWKYGISYSVLDERGQGGIVDVYAHHIVIRGRDLGTVNKDNTSIYDVPSHDVPAGLLILKNKE